MYTETKRTHHCKIDLLRSESKTWEILVSSDLVFNVINLK